MGRRKVKTPSWKNHARWCGDAVQHQLRAQIQKLWIFVPASLSVSLVVVDFRCSAPYHALLSGGEAERLCQLARAGGAAIAFCLHNLLGPGLAHATV